MALREVLCCLCFVCFVFRLKCFHSGEATKCLTRQ
jgi:hypothetical protein